MPSSPMHYVVRFSQMHESFRLSEVEALNRLSGVTCEVLSYSENSPFCVVHFPGGLPDTRQDIDAVVRDYESRAILSKGIYEIWGEGQDYQDLRQDVERRTRHLWEQYRHVSFRFSIDCFGSTRDIAAQRHIIGLHSYLGFMGPIKMKGADEEFAVLEEWLPMESQGGPDPAGVNTPAGSIDAVTGTSLRRVFLTRKIGPSRRWLREKHDLKKRPYISTTSMDAELALFTATLALAGPGKIFLDPFVGTGGFLLAAAELGATVLGSDIDGRSFRGKGQGLEKGVGINFHKYGLTDLLADCFTADLTNTPFRVGRRPQGPFGGEWLDGILCDPPYGVREGLKVLGTRKAPAGATVRGIEKPGSVAATLNSPRPLLVDGAPAHTRPGWIAPKKPYSFARMLEDILDFAAATLVTRGRLAFWMPSANEDEDGQEAIAVIPTHPRLKLIHKCVQKFHRWSRRLLVYEKLPGTPLSTAEDGRPSDRGGRPEETARTADELNPFRQRYFQPKGDRDKRQ